MQWFTNQKISAKLLCSFLFVAVIAAAIGAIGVKNIRLLNASDKDLCEGLHQVSLMGKIETNFHRMRVDVINMIDAATPEEVHAHQQKVKARRDSITQCVIRLEQFMTSKQDRDGVTEIKRQRTIMGPVVDRVVALCGEGRSAEARELWMTEGERARTTYQEAISQLVDLQVNEAEHISEENDAQASSAMLQMTVFILGGFALAIVIGLFIAREITRPLARGVMMMDELSKAHLSVRLRMDRQDEIGILAQRMDSFADALQETVANLLQIAEGNLNVDVRSLDEKDEIAPAMINIVGTLRALVDEVTLLTQAAVDGQLSARGAAVKFKGGYRAVVEGINSTLDKVIMPVSEGAEVLALMAQGDLTARVMGEYKGDHQLIITSINSLAASLDKAMAEVAEAVSATASASSEISSSTEQMAVGAQEQTQQATEVASAVEQMTKTILETTKNADEATAIARKAGLSAQEGGRVVIETMDGMQRIAGVVKHSAVTVQELGNSSDQIGEIVQVIDDIADQTNLLALNAAIEAARAGEQGRGFAVVADEVRKLAERTTKATKEIAQMIRKIQTDTIGAVESMTRGTEEVEKGRRLAEQSSASLREIIGGSQAVVDVVTQVAAASEEQSTASEQIRRNIEAISSVSQQSAAGSQEIARAAEDLNRLTANLQELLARFSISGLGVSSRGSEPRGLTLVRGKSKLRV